MATVDTSEQQIDGVLDSGDNAWMMTSTALVLLMTPALAFFYGGLVDRKNILNQLFLSFVCMGIVLVQWVLVGFTFAFGPPVSKGFGSFGDAALTFGQRLNPIYSPTYPLLTFAAYQGTFAIITPALISGQFSSFPLSPHRAARFFRGHCWTNEIDSLHDLYSHLDDGVLRSVAHWVWGENGWLKELGALDFAGGTVVHILSGISGFVASSILGKRLDYHKESKSVTNIPFTVLGTCLLWVGRISQWIGSVIGLVGITPACGYVQPRWAILFGVIPTISILWTTHPVVVSDRRHLDGHRFRRHMYGIDSASIGIRMSPEEELRGFDFIAHGEKWDISGAKTEQLSSSDINAETSLPPSYPLATRSEINRMKARPRPERTPIRPAYSRSTSQPDSPV